jgi:selenocysteine-specific elongation factor
LTVAGAVRRVIVGTAGHIDHGKTTLVERLTGTRTDRLPEERERGMTIDVGYAELRLPDGTEAGLIDVPGHERLVRTMVAGATSMDLALLVVAADDGPMLQTREHVAILDLLGVRRAVVALTKVDLVDEEHAALVEEEIAEMLRGTTLAGSPVVRVSSTTGEGIEALGAAIAAAVGPLDDRAEDAFVFRMPVLRAFVAEGRGTVVTGIPVAGRVAEGEPVEVLPPRWASRVRGVQVHHRDATEARAGHRAALALADVEATRVKRGMVVATAGAFSPTPRFSARLRILPTVGEPLRHGMAVRLHVGSDQAVARLHLLEGDRAAPGSVTAVELSGAAPFLVAPGDRFVLRAENASQTLGGGVVVERLEARLPRRREGIVASILARAERAREPEALVEGAVRAAGERGTSLEEVAKASALRADALPPVVEALASRGTVVRAGRAPLLFDPEAYRAARRRVLESVAALHRKDPGLPHLPLSSVRSATGKVAPAAFEAVVEDLVRTGDLRRSPEGGVAAKSHSASLSGDEQARCAKVLAALEAGGATPPDEAELRATLGLTPQLMKKTLLLLESRKEVFRAGPLWFHAAWVEGAKARLAAHARAHGSFTAADARTLLATSRKFVIPLLETLDERGFTRRVGDQRVLRDA